jgi:hypothetical protein
MPSTIQRIARQATRLWATGSGRLRRVRTHVLADRRASAGPAKSALAAWCRVLYGERDMTLSPAHTTMLLTHGAPSAGFASCRPVIEPAQRTNDAADAN